MTLKLKSVLVFVVLLISTVSTTAAKPFDWEPVMAAIIQVESEGDPKAVNGMSCGAMQINPILVKDCNNILKARNSKKRYTLQDRFSVKKSKEMFLLIQEHYNKDNNVEKAIRAWNGGVNYHVKSTNRYYRKVLAAMK
ncbi:MAG: lytic transglycosylase domain-containing protein [Prevotella sp.]|nr:lytic transglycosylase domain-containing protein [Prevotella sp.]MDE6151433.1 lytic transglycosylase domain-containing protein [Prevotella sp.]